VTTFIPLPAGLPLDTASWGQTPLVVRQAVVQLLAVIQPQEARLSQHSRNSDRPSSSDPPFVTRPSSSTMKGTPGAKRGHPGPRHVLLAPTAVIEVTPDVGVCGQQEFPATMSYHMHQVIELPEIQMSVTHVVLHETRCPRCGRRLKAELPAEYRYGYGPRLMDLIIESVACLRLSPTSPLIMMSCNHDVLPFLPWSIADASRQKNCPMRIPKD
jgi:transposase